MTNKEAINLISRNKSVFRYDAEMTEALNLAIKALETIDQIKFNVYALNELLQEAENEQTTN